MQRDSLANTLVVTAVLGITCSLLVSGAAVGLRDLQQKNKAAAFQSAILDAADLSTEGSDPTTVFKKHIEPRIVDLDTGTYLEESTLDPHTYDQRRAARDPELSIKIPAELNLAGIGRREKFATVYLVHDASADTVDRIVFPIYGKGLFSTLYGFITLDDDLDTVRGINYYQHGETPGLGAQVEEEKWQNTWGGKRVYGPAGDPVIRLVKNGADGPYEIDGLSGATLTSNGVTNMVHYWLGDHGFARFIHNLRNNTHTNGG